MKKHRLLLLVTLISLNALAGPKEQAWKLHNRLTGVPPMRATLNQMEELIKAGNPEAAAELAIGHKNFYNIVLKNWIKPWSNREQTSRTELNDFTSTILGVIRDSDTTPFTQILHADIIYTLNYMNADNTPSMYSMTNNDHYKNAETRNIDLSTALTRQTQSVVTGLPAAAVSGVITTRAAGEAFFSAGTNRRVNRYTFMNFLCHDYEALHDVTIPDIKVRRDVERNPGGDTRTYKNKCVGCHAGQDALGGAYAYYDFVGNRLVYTPGTVVTKMNHNVYFKEGYITTDDSWINLWAGGQNARLGWRGATSGRGVKEIGQMFSRSQAFSQCMTKKVFKLVCLKEPLNVEDMALAKTLATGFEQSNYNMKDLIINTSVGCIVHEE